MSHPRRRRRYRVAGDSMYPLLRDGAEIDVDLAAYDHEPPQPGDVVLARHPFRRDTEIVKRVLRVGADGRVFLVGDDPVESSDSRSFGPLPRHLVLGRVEIG